MTHAMYMISNPDNLHTLGRSLPLDRMRMTSGSIVFERPISTEQRQRIREIFAEGLRYMDEEYRERNRGPVVFLVTVDFFDGLTHVITGQWSVRTVTRSGFRSP